MTDLIGKIAIVTGASRGAGQGIATELGAAGATVYVTGRTPSDIEETARLATEKGGMGIAIRCDHTIDSEVEAVVHRVYEEQKRIDLLVNNVWGGYEQYDQSFDDPFWKQPLWRWNKMFDAGVRAHYTASRLVAPFMMKRRSGLIVNTIAWDQGKYLGSVLYDVAKTASSRMAYCMALELKEHQVTSVAVAPGWMRTKVVLKHFHTDEDHWTEIPELQTTESTRYIGRSIVALASDPQILKKTGRTLTAGDLAAEYKFTDIDGRQVPPFRIPEDSLKV